MKKIITIILDIRKEAIKLSSILYFTETILLVLSAFLSSLFLYFQQFFFDGVANYLCGAESEKIVLKGLLFFVGLNILSYIINSFCDFFPRVTNSGLRISLRKKLQDKISSSSYVDFENTDFLDKLNKAEEGRYNTVGLYYVVRQAICFYLPYFIFVSLYIFKINLIIGIGIWLIFAPVILSHIIHVKLYVELEDNIAPIRRICNHYDDCITSRDYFKETRLYGAVSFFAKKFHKSLNRIISDKYKTDMKVCKYDTIIRLIIAALYCVILLLMFFLFLNKHITVGLFISLNTCIANMFAMMEDFVYNKIGYMSTQMGSIYNYYNFINSNYEQKKENTSLLDVEGDIIINNVSFKYPYADKYALKDVSFKIKSGETIAIVGENGSGKSTLSKIMMGLIPPTQGKVFYGRRDIEGISNDVLYSNISAIFQNYNKYSISLKDNIIVSDYNKKYNKDDLNQLCYTIGLNPFSDKFPSDYETILSREFEGIDVSGGEWQKIALIRGKFRRHKYIFLDEPTSAIDPIEEMKLYKIFSDISRDVTSVIITHRLGAARLADRIIVMKNGKLIEIGTHKNLLNNKSEYYRLWNLQKQWYTKQKGNEI